MTQRYPLPDLNTLPEDIRTRILEVQDKAGFIPNVFLAFARRPDEWRAFFAYHDALMLREILALQDPRHDRLRRRKRIRSQRRWPCRRRPRRVRTGFWLPG